MDKHILLVKSDIETTRAIKNRNLVSFHKRMHCCFNSTVLEEVGILPGMYASFMYVNHNTREICICVKKERPTLEKSKLYKITNPKVSERNRYCYIRTTNLVYDFDLLPLGAFEYYSMKSLTFPNTQYIYIKY